jgi:hypothetical protein
MDFDHNWESDVWEKNDEFWEKLSAKWVVDEGQTKEFRTIWAR